MLSGDGLDLDLHFSVFRYVLHFVVYAWGTYDMRSDEQGLRDDQEVANALFWVVFPRVLALMRTRGLLPAIPARIAGSLNTTPRLVPDGVRSFTAQFTIPMGESC